MDTMYQVEQGHVNPRDNSVFWTAYEAFPTLATAKAEVKNQRGRWRIIQMKVVWMNELAKTMGD
jgi:hypothetical protein